MSSTHFRFSMPRPVIVAAFVAISGVLAAGSPAAAASSRSGISLTIRGSVLPAQAGQRRLDNAPPALPQSQTQTLQGLALSDTTGAVPADAMGAVGPTEFLFAVNGRYRAFSKNTPNSQVWDVSDQAFWGSHADPSGVTAPHVRYDPTSQRWFITAIDMKDGDNHLLLAVSNSAELSGASWTLYTIPATGATSAADAGCFADYDTPGIDQNAIYIGANIFQGINSCAGSSYLHSNLYVIQKAGALSGTLQLTQFFNVATGTDSIPTIQGVDSIDPSAAGYAVAVNESTFPAAGLNIWTINNPGSTSPTLSSPVNVPISPEDGTLGGVLTANNTKSPDQTRMMDDIDDRLFSATLRNGQLWTAHNLAVSSTGNSNSGTLDRDAVRWYDVSMSGTPALNQSGTVYDTATASPQNYWMGTVMVSGQGHVALGLNSANATTVVQAGATGRLVGDPAGTMRAVTTFQASTNDNYDDRAFNPGSVNRWGDYSYTSLDPCDDMTMWTTQAYIAGNTSGVDWKTVAEKLSAPPPAVLATGTLATVAIGSPSVSINLIGSSPNGEGFYDTPNTILDSCRKRLTVSATNGVTVTGVTYVDPLHVTVQLNTSGATNTVSTLTITNPDGQSVAGSLKLSSASPIDTVGVYRGGSFLLRLSNSSGPADITVAFNPPGKNLPIVGDWTGAGYDAIGVYNQSNGVFTLCTQNSTSACAVSSNLIGLVLGNPNDTPLSGRWQATASHAGAGVFRPSNGILYMKNALTTGYSDYSDVLGNPGDIGVAGDWTGKGYDSPGVYRPGNAEFYLSNQVTNGIVYGDIAANYGSNGDLPVMGDWIGQGHDGIGMFLPQTAMMSLRDSISAGAPDNSFAYSQSDAQPIAGHWQTTYPSTAPGAAPTILVLPTATPNVPTTPSGGSVAGGNQIGG